MPSGWSNPFIYAMTLGLASALHVYRNEFSQALERADASLQLLHCMTAFRNGPPTPR